MIGCGVAEEWEPSRRGISEHQSHKGFVKQRARFFRGTPGGSGYGAKGFVAWIEFGKQGLDVGPKDRVRSKVTPRNLGVGLNDRGMPRRYSRDWKVA